MSEHMTVGGERGDDYRVEHIGFGRHDAKGRELGVLVARWSTTLGFGPCQYCSWSRLAPGHYLVVRVQAARNGRHYGATQGAHYFETEAELEAFVARRVADSRRRAAR